MYKFNTKKCIFTQQQSLLFKNSKNMSDKSNFSGNKLLKTLGYKDNFTYAERQAFYQKGVRYKMIGGLLALAGIIGFLFSIVLMVFLLENGPAFPYPIVMIPLIFIGMFVTGFGNAICKIAKEGAAASGLMLDPKQEREDKKELNKGIGGQLNDILEEMPAITSSSSKEIIKIKCRDCGHLNDEHDKFCGGCGNAL